MRFKKLPDNMGMIYEPDSRPESRKNPCPDCFSCQWCGNERCRLCHGRPPEEPSSISRTTPDPSVSF